MNKQIAALATDKDNVVMWDINTLLLDYQDHPSVVVDTKLLIPNNWLMIDKEYALKTDVNSPLILFELPNSQLYIADGNHRLYRALIEDAPKMNVIIIPQEKHLSYLFRSTVEDYYRVVSGLRDEGIFIKNFICDSQS